MRLTTGGFVLSSDIVHAAPAVVSGAGGAAARPDVSPRQMIFDLTNAERQRAGIPPVGYDPALLAAAQALADDMARQRGRNGLLLIGLVGLSGASLCGSSLWWLRRRQGSRRADLAT